MTNVRLPSIGELTSHSPIDEKSLSPRSTDFRLLPAIHGKHAVKTPSTNYVLGNTNGSPLWAGSSTISVPTGRAPSSAPNPIRPINSIAPVPAFPLHQLPVLSHQAPSAGSSPTYQYYSYQHSPVLHPGVAGQPQGPLPPLMYSPSPNSYYQAQPVRYRNDLSSASAAYAHPQYAIPEIINKPSNKCHRCGTTETPEWRRGPNGVRTLCNACGLFHAKLVKRKGAALAAEEVLNNKVCKGKNGRRISLKKHLLNESLLKTSDGINNKPLYQSHPQSGVSLPLPNPLVPNIYGGAPNNYTTHHTPPRNYTAHIAMPLIRH